jgi:hypothetical protein
VAQSRGKRREREEFPILHAGRRLLAPIEELLRSLRAEPAHGNRTLFYDQLVVAHLLAFFNTSVKSLRTIEDVFESETVRRNLNMPRVPKSTLSDAQRVFDPDLLKPVLQRLKDKMPATIQDPKLAEIVKDLVAVDGTFFTVAARVLWALHGRPNDPDAPPTRRAFRADVHFDVVRGVPEHVVVDDGRRVEQDSLAKCIQPSKLYILDRAYQGFQLYADIVDAGSDFVVRMRESITPQCVAVQTLTAEDRAAGVFRDEHVYLPSYRAKQLRDVPVRVVEFEFVDRNGMPCTIRLLTNRLDLTAETIVLIYRYRWQVELFFRWLKCFVNLRHFFSDSKNGATLQVYVAVIATLLLALKTNAPPNKYDFALIGHVIGGLIPLEEASAISERRHRERQLAKQARIRKQGRA